MNARISTFRRILVLVLERPPRIHVVPEVVEALDFGPRSFGTTKSRNGLSLRESRFTVEHGGPEIVEVLRGRFAGRGELVGDRGVDGIELTTSVEFREGFHCFRDTFEEGIVVRVSSGRSLLVGVVTKNLAAV